MVGRRVIGDRVSQSEKNEEDKFTFSYWLRRKLCKKIKSLTVPFTKTKNWFKKDKSWSDWEAFGAVSMLALPAGGLSFVVYGVLEYQPTILLIALGCFFWALFAGLPALIYSSYKKDKHYKEGGWDFD